jgi:galactitol-specific phosphotransferase system IIC component
MNRLLIGILDIVNKLLALFLIVSSTIEGYRGDLAARVGVMPANSAQQVMWAVAGFVVGLLLAGIFAGFIAAIITIARELSSMRELLAMRVWTNPPPT